MEEPLPLNGSRQSPPNEIAQAIQEHRERARTFFGQWHAANDLLEERLRAQIDEVNRQWSVVTTDGATADAELDRRRSEIQQDGARLEQLRQDLAQRENQWQQMQEDLRLQQQQLLAEILQRKAEVDERLTQLAEIDILHEERMAFISNREERLEQRQQRLEALRDELDERDAAIRGAMAELEERARIVRDEALAAESLQLEHDAAVDQIQAKRRELEADQEQLAELAAGLRGREERLHQRELDTQSQRRRIARELKSRQESLLSEIALRRDELNQDSAAEDAQLEVQLAMFQEELVRLRAQTEQRGSTADQLHHELENATVEIHGLRSQLTKRQAENARLIEQLDHLASTDHHSASEVAQLAAQLAEAREQAESQHAASQVALAQARSDHEQLRTALTKARQQADANEDQAEALRQETVQLRRQLADVRDQGVWRQQIDQLEKERDALLDRLQDAETRADARTAGGTSAEVEDLRRRFEMAIDDVRSLKSRNADLEERLSRAGSNANNARASEGPLDWEAQKRKLLAQLEADFDENDEQEKADRLTVEGAIRITDQVVSEKDREIGELKRLLDDQSKNLGTVAVGAAAIAEMLDSDELISQERDNLKRMQDEWREKLRKAEIDISVERAKIARERAQLEEKLQVLEQQLARSEPAGPDAVDDKDKKPRRSRWLARLGLSEEGEK